MQKCFVRSLSVVTFLVGAVAGAEIPLLLDTRMPVGVRQDLVSDLNFVRDIEGSGETPRHQRLLGRVRGGDYLSFLYARIRYVRYVPARDDVTMAYVQGPYYTTMWLTTNVTRYQAPQLFRVNYYWHESRHGEWAVGGWQHTVCPPGTKDLKGETVHGLLSQKSLIGFPGCDSSTDGAYGLTATMMGNLIRFCTNCGEKTKADAELLRDDAAGRLLGESLRSAVLDDLKK